MAKSDKYRQDNEEFLKNLDSQEGIFKLPKNIRYQVLQSGDGAQPTLRNVVSVYYKGYLINGKVFDDNTRQGYPDAFRLTELIEGWQIAITRMHVGDKWKIFIPQELGYGKRGSDGIPGFSTLIFEIELKGMA